MTHSSVPALAPVDAASEAAPPPDVSARLYRAAIGPVAQQHYLQVFSSFDAVGRAGVRWHGPACVSALNWLGARGLWGAAWAWAGAALLGSVLLLGLARLLFDLTGDALLGLLAGAVLLSSLAWGCLAHAFYHRVCKRRILRAVAASRTLDEACRLLDAAAQRRPAWPLLAALNLPMLLAIAAGLLLLQPPPAAPVRMVALPRTAASGPVAAAVAPAAAATATASTASPASAAAQAQVDTLPCTDCSVAPSSSSSSSPSPSRSPLPSPSSALAPAAPPPLDAQPVADAARAPGSAVPPPAPGTAASPPARTRGFAVQVGVFAQPPNVDKLLVTLRGAALNAYAEPANPPAAVPLRVRAGPFATREQAQQAAERIRQLDLPAVVVRLRDPGPSP